MTQSGISIDPRKHTPRGVNEKTGNVRDTADPLFLPSYRPKTQQLT